MGLTSAAWFGSGAWTSPYLFCGYNWDGSINIAPLNSPGYFCIPHFILRTSAVINCAVDILDEIKREVLVVRKVVPANTEFLSKFNESYSVKNPQLQVLRMRIFQCQIRSLQGALGQGEA